MQENRKKILKHNFSLLEMEYMMAIVISSVNTVYSLLQNLHSWNKALFAKEDERSHFSKPERHSPILPQVEPLFK